ncbi:hypothetical protein AB3R30_25445 [Leptolyngbyaceae cyanobacterium UHCC 1019]
MNNFKSDLMRAGICCQVVFVLGAIAWSTSGLESALLVHAIA